MTAVGKAVLGHVVTSLLMLGAATMLLLFPQSASAQLGRTVTNIATLSYEYNGVPTQLTTNPAVFRVEARRTPSSIEFFRHAPGAATFVTRVHGTDYNPEGDIPLVGALVDPFIPIGPARTSGGVVLDLSGNVPLAPAATFMAGELIFVLVTDEGQNGDPAIIETIIITIRSDAGDQIVLRLYETGPDTGQFIGYVPSSRGPSPPDDPVLTAPGQTKLTAIYADQFDETDATVDTALVDPFGRLFDSVTGALINGVTVTIVDAVTGQPAGVFGADGVSIYPSTLVTGTRVTDASGAVYDLEAGEFLFPLMAQGTYRLLIEPPTGYLFPSSRTSADFAGLENAPFEIIAGSYGGNFEVTSAGPLNFDVPLDASGEILLRKSTPTTRASVGDTVGYVVEVTNRNSAPLPVIIEDRLPRGFRLVAGSVRIDGFAPASVSLSPDGQVLRVNAGPVRAGQTLRLTYALAVSAGASLGEAVNQAVAVNGAGNPISNRAEVAIEVVEDLLRSRLTLVGRVAEDACYGGEEWARKLSDGRGVPGVRIYMESGEYAVTDQDGLYHFEGIRPGTHVVQIDTATLPQGYVPMVCEENSRYAGSSISKFVDARGGSVWRANFYLKRVSEIAAAKETAVFDDTTEYLGFDREWLDQQDTAPRWVYPETSRTPSSRSVNIGIVHAQGQTVELMLNGRVVSAANFSGRTSSESSPAELSRWRGVDILAGKNEFSAKVTDGAGTEVARLQEDIWYITEIEHARLVDDQSVLVADGRTAPVIAVRLENAAGRPVHKGRSADVDISEPYLLRRDDTFQGDGVADTGRLNAGVVVGADGIARITLEPTLRTGRVRVRVRLDTGREQDINVWLAPETRDWILVGLAEGSNGLEQIKDTGRGPARELRDGRLAFFAKGMVKGDWLLTLAVDTARRRGARDTSLFEDHIDPNAYYTLYGDRTWQYSEAESRYPLYVKLEKTAAQFLFGDFNTDLSDAKLGRYNRRLSGIKADTNGRNFSFTGFAAETNQGFIKDELAADGTSGPYRLSAAPVVRNSEIITVETRERVRPDEVIALRTLTRWIDYELDYRTGELVFRSPVNVSDAGFNPNIIVVDYEVSADVDRNVTFGGRGAAHMADRRLELGATYVSEEGSIARAQVQSDLAAVDFTAKLSGSTELRAEVATSSRDTGTGTERGAAYLAEIGRRSETLSVSGFIHQEEAGFGLGQQGSATAGVRRLGAAVSGQVDESIDEGSGRRERLFVDAKVYTEQALSSVAARDVGEFRLRSDSEQTGIEAGLKAVRERLGSTGEIRESVLAVGLVRHFFVEHGLTVSASHEEPVTGRGESSLFPRRTLLGADKVLTEWATLNLRHEINNGANASGENTLAGVTLRPWKGGEVRAAADQITQDSDSRLSATLGVDQSFSLTKAWSANLGAARRARVDGDDAAMDDFADAARSPFEDGARSDLVGDGAFASAYAGLGYRVDKAAASGRIEYRDSALGTRWSGVVGAAREANDTLSYATALSANTEARGAGEGSDRIEARVGAAWRPRGEGMIFLARLDAKAESEDDLIDTRKLVGNFAANMMLSARTQASINLGLKHQQTDVLGQTTSGYTTLLGGETRYDISPKVDIGLAASVLKDYATGTAEYALGPSIGFTPAKNVWVSVGYNVFGFKDHDFEAAEYSDQGLFVKLRVKFDQQSMDGLLQRISPN